VKNGQGSKCLGVRAVCVLQLIGEREREGDRATCVLELIGERERETGQFVCYS